MRDVTVSIISHGHKAYIDNCLTSLFKHSLGLDIEVYLILNSHEEGLEGFVRSKFPQVEVLKNQRPLGFSENNNRVYRITRSRYFILLNPDTVILNDALPLLVAFLNEHPLAGACGPKLLYPDGRLQLSCRDFPTLRSVLFRRTPLRTLFSGNRIANEYTMAGWDHGTVREVGWVFGACLMVRRSAADTVGLLDEELFLFCEDIDWCYRLKHGGWKIFYIPEARVQHDLDDVSYNQFWGSHRRLHYRSMYRYWRKNMAPWSRIEKGVQGRLHI
jgi:hypothetical protein